MLKPRQKRFSFILSAGLLVASSHAVASQDGLLTIFVGFPVLLIACAVLALLWVIRRLVVRAGKTVRSAAIILFVPTLAYSLYVALDALTLFRGMRAEESTVGLAFFCLLIFDCLVFYFVIAKPIVEDVKV